MDIRPGEDRDKQVLWDLDLIARESQQRRDFITNAINDQTCCVAESDTGLLGYGVLNYSFYSFGCVDMLYIHEDHRRTGAGAALLEHMESLCETTKLFASTNLSNLPMQALLNKRGYVISGVINNLDENDPEIVYLKVLE